MKRIVLVVCILLATGLTAFAQGSESPLGVWKEQFASPTYGVAFIPCTISDLGGTLAKKELALPGLDLRLFQGTNITKRGGFFTGYEFGALFFASKPEGISFAGSYSDITGTYQLDYTASLNYVVGMAFLMGKYGYRLDIGFALIGLSLGAELGIGMRLIEGNCTVSSTIASLDKRTIYWNTVTNPANLLLDAALEAALRLGRNFRIIARLGAMLTPDFIEGPDHGGWSAYKDDIRDAAGAADALDNIGDVDALLQRYDIYLAPLIPSARVGFSLSY